MRKEYEAEERREHGEKVNENRPMKELRAGKHEGMDNADSIRRGGGEDPRRYAAHVIMDTKVRDHDMSGYNHNGVIDRPEAAAGNNRHMAMMEAKVMHMGTPNPDGTYDR